MTRSLSEMVDSFVFVGGENQQLAVVRLKFLNLVMGDERLLDAAGCQRHKFETRVVNFIVHCYLNSAENALLSTESADNTTATTSSSSSSSSASESAYEKELVQLVHNSVAKLNVFQQAGLRFNSTIEHFLNAFVAKQAIMFKQTEV